MRDGLTFDDLHIRLSAERHIRMSTHVAPGDILTVMGPSGSGKTTLLDAITGTLPRDFEMTGRIAINGTDLTRLAPENRRIGILFQDHLLFPHMSVGENLAFGLSRAVRKTADRHARIDAALDDVGLSGMASRDPATLSGGQKARVALMRVLLSDPRALLLDEPFARLDATLRDQIRQLVFRRARDQRLPVVLVTHDHEDAAAAGGRVLDMERDLLTR